MEWFENCGTADLEDAIMRCGRRPARPTLAEDGDWVVEGRLRSVIGQYVLFEGALRLAAQTGCAVRLERLGEQVVERRLGLF